MSKSILARKNRGDDVLIKRLSLALRLTDDFSDLPIGPSEVQLFVNGVRCRHEYKPNGYFIISDLDEGEYIVSIRSSKFQTEEFTAVVDNSLSMPAEKMVRYIALNPSNSYPMAFRCPRITGTAPDVQKIYILRAKGDLKIAEDGANAGNSLIKLFCNGIMPRLPSMFRIKDKTHSEIVTIIGSNDNVYMLGSPLKNSYPRSSAVTPLIRLVCGGNGKFFFVIPDEFRPDKDGNIKLSALCENRGEFFHAELCAKPAGVTELGEIKFRKGDI